MARRPIITITTDFGLSDSYVAQMKGVILGMTPAAAVVDISHLVPAHDICGGALILRDAVAHFPDRTVHLAVVDPGVGTERRRIIIQCVLGAEKKQAITITLVGPDNGLFSLAAPLTARRGVWAIENLKSLPYIEPTSTFEGRSVFAPVAALLASGKKPSDFGPLIEEPGAASSAIVELCVGGAIEIVDNEIVGSVVAFDSFGNAITNISGRGLDRGRTTVELMDETSWQALPFVQTYHDIGRNQLGCLVNSQGYVELACRETSARDKGSIALGTRVRVTLPVPN